MRATRAKNVRVIMIEPQGQGGICHYTYSLCAALQDMQGAEVTLVTGRSYELLDAPRSYTLAAAFGPGLGRRAIQWALRRPDLRLQAQPVLASSTSREPHSAKLAETNVKTTPYRATSVAGRASQWLANREAEYGWRRALRLAGRSAGRTQPSVAHIQWLTDPEHDHRWIEAFHRRGVPVILTAHNVLPHDAPPDSRRIWARLYEAVDGIIVHYQRALDELSSLGIDLGKVAVIPHGNYCAIQALTEGALGSLGSLGSLGAGDTNYANNGRAVARRRLGVSAEAPVVLYFGLMRPYKGIQHLLPAFASLRQALPEARLILAGRAPEGFAPIQAEIVRLGLEEAIIPIPMYLPLQTVAEVFAACDVVALPYVEASQSGVVQLAYAYSRPVVATRVGGIPEAVRDGETGILVEPHNPQQLAQALVTLLGNREDCARLGRRARQFAEEQFAWAPIAARTAQFYKRSTRTDG